MGGGRICEWAKKSGGVVATVTYYFLSKAKINVTVARRKNRRGVFYPEKCMILKINRFTRTTRTVWIVVINKEENTEYTDIAYTQLVKGTWPISVCDGNGDIFFLSKAKKKMLPLHKEKKVCRGGSFYPDTGFARRTRASRGGHMLRAEDTCFARRTCALREGHARTTRALRVYTSFARMILP